MPFSAVHCIGTGVSIHRMHTVNTEEQEPCFAMFSPSRLVIPNH